VKSFNYLDSGAYLLSLAVLNISIAIIDMGYLNYGHVRAESRCYWCQISAELQVDLVH
jgi:hypothetical protein